MNTRILVVVASLLLGTACGGESNRFEEGFQTLGAPRALGGKLAFIVPERNQTALLDVGAELEPEVDWVELPRAATLAVDRSGEHTELLVLCQGRRGSRKESPEPAELAALAADGSLRRFELGNPFDTVQQSEDGRYAVLLKTQATDRTLDNPNEIAVVDLEADPDKAVHLRTLRSFGGTPTHVYFSPSMRIAEEDRRLAIIFTEADVQLLDLNHLDRRETTAPLTGNTGRAIVPEQVIFDTARATFYVRGAASDDVFAFQLEARSADDEGNDFSPFINELGAGEGPQDMALFDYDESSIRLLVASTASQQAVIINAASSKTTFIELDQPADRILLFDGGSPGDPQLARRALLYQTGSSSVSFLDLEGVEERRARNLESMNIGQPVARLIPLLNGEAGERQLALVIHASTGVSLLDLADRTVTPISSSQTLSDALYDPAARRLWLGPVGQPWLGYLDVDDGVTGEIQLDQPIEHLVPFFNTGHFAVVHPSRVGHVSLLQSDRPQRDSAESVLGFLIEGLLP